MPHLPERGNNGACPDAATVLAVIEGEADEWLRHAYAQHLSQCAACLDLDTRLRNFDRPVLANEAEWKQTEKRLDNWMRAFLPSQATVPAVQAVEKRPAPAGFWRSLWKPSLAWKLSLATALVVLVAVGVDVYLRLQPEAKAPVTAPPLPAPPEPAVPGGGVPQGGPMAEALAPAPPAQVPPTVERKETVAKAGAPSGPQQQPAVKGPPTAPVKAAKPPATSTEQTEVATTGGKPSADSTERADICPTCARVPSATKRGMANVVAERILAPTPDAQARTPLPASLHLAAGVRLWLALESFNFQEDGRVIFHGSLLLPLNSAGSSALDHGTEVSGFVTSTQGQTSVLLSEIVIRGLHYKLMSKPGAGNARTSGSGGAVQFDSGKVLEMWVSSDSVYELSGESAQ